LSGHNFCVDASNLHTGEQTRLVVGLNDVSAVDLAGTDTTVVWSLGGGETHLWPAIWPTIETEEGVFLLKTEPWFLFGIGLHQSGTVMAVVEFVGRPIVIPALAEDEDIVATTEWIGKDSDGTEVDI
jgi:hypothetical protein